MDARLDGLKGLRIGVWSEPPQWQVAPDVAASFQRTLGVLEAAGAVAVAAAGAESV